MNAEEHEHIQRQFVLQVAERLNLASDCDDEAELLRRIGAEEPDVKRALDAFRDAYRRWFTATQQADQATQPTLVRAMGERDRRRDELIATLQAVAWKHRPTYGSSLERLQAAGILDNHGNVIDPYGG